MADDPTYTWDADDLVYRDADGKAVARRSVRGDDDSATDELAAAAILLLRSAADRFVARQESAIAADDADAGTAAFRDWQAEHETVVKRAAVAGAVIAAGGLAQADAVLKARATEAVRFHLGFFRDFVAAVERGEMVLDGRIGSRAELYAGAAISSFEREWRARHGVKYREERRVLGSVRPCEDCVGYAGQGWVPVGTLPDIGAACECKSNCRCAYVFRLRVD